MASRNIIFLNVKKYFAFFWQSCSFLLDKGGKITISPKFDLVSLFEEGKAAVRIDGLWGYINYKGEWFKEPIKIKGKSAIAYSIMVDKFIFWFNQ